MQTLPGLNFDSKLSVDDLSFFQEQVEKAILDRAKAMDGQFALGVGKYGICDSLNPREIVSSDIYRPLLVSKSANFETRVNATSGFALTRNCAVVHLASSVEDFDLGSVSINDVVVIFLENEIVDGPPVRLTRYNTLQATRKVQSTDILRSAKLIDWNNASLFSPPRKDNIVVLAVVTVVGSSTVSGQKDLKFDYTNAVYPFNRPWFSAVDVEHRSYLGSGTPTAQNPHGTSFNDLVSAGLTFYDQMLPIGQVQSRDDDLPGLCGTFCTETVPPSRIMKDNSLGTVTGSSRFGGPFASYFVLSKYPNAVTAFYFSSNKGRSVGFDWIPQTRVVVIPVPENLNYYVAVTGNVLSGSSVISNITTTSLDVGMRIEGTGIPINTYVTSVGANSVTMTNNATQSATNVSFRFYGADAQETIIEYVSTDAGRLPAAPVGSTITFSQPLTAKELIISGGLTVDSLSNPSLSFDGTGPIPRIFDMYVTSDGQIISAPGVVGVPVRLENLGTSQIAVTYSLFGPCKISFGLAEASVSPNMSIKIRVYGKDSYAQTFTEDLQFSGTTWQPVTLGVDNPYNRVVSENIFYEIDAFQVIERLNDGFQSEIVMFAEYETGATTALGKLAKLASVLWDSTSLNLNSFKDERKITRTIAPELNRFSSGASVLGMGGTYPCWLLSEDLARPAYRNSARGYSDATYAQGKVTILDFIGIVSGSSIRLPNGKTLASILVGIPNRGAGQYLASGSNGATVESIVATLNDPDFNSGYFAEVDTTNPNRVIITVSDANLKGARGNGEITEPIPSGLGAIEITQDMRGGIDAYGETLFPKHAVSISCTVPSAALLPATGFLTEYDVRSITDRYESIPVSIGNKAGVVIRVHGLEPFYSSTKIQVRIRYSTSSDAQWSPWALVAGNGGYFEFTPGSGQISKIQLNIFGAFSGYSLYETAS